jgi:hypothetical protein
MQTYVVHHSGSLAERDGKAKDLPTGKIMVLNMSVVQLFLQSWHQLFDFRSSPDLTDTTHFEESTVDYPWDSIGRDCEFLWLQNTFFTTPTTIPFSADLCFHVTQPETLVHFVVFSLEDTDHGPHAP